MQIAPIALFVYNRPWHTQQTLEALSKNILATQSTLYIFADGPKENRSETEVCQIKEVRQIIRLKKWCKEVHIIESDNNNGLANSVINGINRVLNSHSSIIVLEDDIIVSRGFLDYMNTALTLYKDTDKVMTISGYNFPLPSIQRNNKAYFIPLSTTGAWATWKRAWNFFDTSASGYDKLKTDNSLRKKFDLDNSFSYSDMLITQMESDKISSWAIKWWWTVFKHKGIVLYPDKSLVYNIGWDGSGVHSGKHNPFETNDFDINYFISSFPDQTTTHDEYFSKIKSYIYNSVTRKRTEKKEGNGLISKIVNKILDMLRK